MAALGMAAPGMADPNPGMAAPRNGGPSPNGIYVDGLRKTKLI